MTSRAALAVLLVLPLAAGCAGSRRSGPKAGGTLSAEEAARVREHALQAESNEAVSQAGVARENMPMPAPEAVPVKSKILKKDERGCTWIESRGVVTASEDETLQQVRASAVNEARRVAMKDFLGVNVRSRTLDFQQEGLKENQQVIETMLLTTRQGRILDEQVLSEDYVPLSDCPHCRYAVDLRACILPTPDYADKDFSVDLGISRNRLVEGDAVTVNVTPSKECWVYIYDLWEDLRQASLIAPNNFVPEIHLKAGQTFEYPNERAEDAGAGKLVAELPKGAAVSAETVRVIAVKQPLPSSIVDPSQGYLAVVRRLNAKRIDWAEDAQNFTIYKK